MAVKISAVNTKVGTRGLLEEIVSSLAPDYCVSDVKSLISDFLKERNVEATVKEVVEAVNLGIEKGVLRVSIILGDGRWTIIRTMPVCKKCNGSGIIGTGNNGLPCECPPGDRALFSVAGVDGPVTGKEVKKHFLNGSPEPIEIGRGISVSAIPGRE